jgi:hypothetical protein
LELLAWIGYIHWVVWHGDGYKTIAAPEHVFLRVCSCA